MIHVSEYFTVVNILYIVSAVVGAKLEHSGKMTSKYPLAVRYGDIVEHLCHAQMC